MAEVSGEVAIVTGGGGGLGREVAVQLAERGVAVAVAGRTAASLDDTVAAVRDAGGEGMAVPCDVRSERETDAAFAACEAAYGPCSVLVHAAAVHGTPMPFVDVSASEWTEVYETNLFSAFACTRAALRQMLPVGRGSVVLVSSPGVLRGFPLAAPYAATKSALVGLARTLAAEVSPQGVRVNVLTPGAMTTTAIYATAARGIGEGLGLTEEEMTSALTEMSALRREVTVEEVARATVFLALDATAMTGHNLVTDGGLTN